MNQDQPAQATLQRTAEEIFEILVRENADMLTAYLRSVLRSSPLADDLFQETMLIAWRRLDDFDRSRPFGPWLRGIARHLVLEHHRQSHRDHLRCEPEVLEALEQRFTRISTLSGDSFKDRTSRLHDCLDNLPERMRETIHLGYGRGMLLREVATALNTTNEAVKKRMQRARLLLMQCLLKVGEEA